jgi:hypothetical protein
MERWIHKMNAFDYRKVLTPRRLRIAYTSPPICEGDFSATGSTTISLQDLFTSPGPTGLVMEPYFGSYILRWNRVPGALCYSIYRLADELNPFSPYILVAECVNDTSYEVNSGCYCITAITPEGETECGSQFCTPAEDPLPPLPPYVPVDPEPEPPVVDPVPPPDIPGTCGNGSPPVPEELLEELSPHETICSTSAGGATAGEVDFVTPSGRIAAKYGGGYVWDDCTLGSPAVPIKDAFIPNCWLIHDGEISFISSQFGCYGATGTPPQCSPALETQLYTEFPDGVFDHGKIGCGSCGPKTYAPTDAIVGETQTFRVNGSPQAGACPNGGSLSMTLLRTHAFIPQPSSLTIQSFASIKYNLGCSPANDTGVQWNGVIDDSYQVTGDNYQCFDGYNNEFMGETQLVSADVRLVAGVKWTFNVIGWHPVNGYQMLFSGEKRYGQTAQGNYGRTGGCSTLGCITLV